MTRVCTQGEDGHQQEGSATYRAKDTKQPTMHDMVGNGKTAAPNDQPQPGAKDAGAHSAVAAWYNQGHMSTFPYGHSVTWTLPTEEFEVMRFGRMVTVMLKKAPADGEK